MVFDEKCKKTLFQIRDFLRSIDQKISHLVEQNRTDRQVYFDNLRIRNENNGDWENGNDTTGNDT